MSRRFPWGETLAGVRVHPALALLLTLGASLPLAHADESTPTRKLGLDDAVQEALSHHPRLKAGAFAEALGAEQVREARMVALPALGVSAEVNRSTSNTTPGAFFPVRGLPQVAGAPRVKGLDSGAWQSGVGLWATWDVFSLVRQATSVDEALAGRDEASAVLAARRLDVAYRAADAFLLVLEADAVARAGRANEVRADVLLTTTKALVAQTLRPGADAARAEAELAAARTQVARAEQGCAVRRAQLAEALGTLEVGVEVDPGRLLESPDRLVPPNEEPVAAHPEIRAADAQVARVDEAQRRVRLDYLPRVDLVAALWARGSGTFDSPASGLVPDVANWGAGATLSWSVLEIPAVGARARIAAANKSVVVARRDEAKLAVSAQLVTARAVLRGALAVCAETPKALAAASAAEQQAVGRYKSGVAGVLEVADADRLLAQAELDDSIARLELRRALLLLARASGDLGPTLRALRTGGR